MAADPNTTAWIAAGAGLVGALVGAGASYLAQRGAWTREDKHRWDADRRRTYAKFAALATEIYDQGSDKAAELYLGKGSADDGGEFKRSFERVLMAGFEVSLIGSPDMKALIERVAKALDHVALAIVALAAMPGQIGKDAGMRHLETAEGLWEGLLDEFHSFARRDLGLPESKASNA